MLSTRTKEMVATTLIMLSGGIQVVNCCVLCKFLRQINKNNETDEFILIS